MSPPVLLRAEALSRVYRGRRRWLARRRPDVHALRAVSFELARGEALGLVGESGSGKSTLARLIVGLDTPSSGTLRVDGQDLARARRRAPRAWAGRIQYVFQDPVAALNPRVRVREAIEAPLAYLLRLDRRERARRLDALVDSVGIDRDLLDRYPHELSGGQAQRVGIARALAPDPELVVLDEPVSALDVSVQAQVLGLLEDLRARLGLSYLFISHDLAVVESIADRIAVMHAGRIVEIGPSGTVLSAPRDPYTRSLLEAVPRLGAGSLSVPLGPPARGRR